MRRLPLFLFLFCLQRCRLVGLRRLQASFRGSSTRKPCGPGAPEIYQGHQVAEAELAVVNQHMAGDAMHLGAFCPFSGSLPRGRAILRRRVCLRTGSEAATLRGRSRSRNAAGLRSRMGECRMGVGDHEAAVGFFEKAVAVFESKATATTSESPHLGADGQGAGVPPANGGGQRLLSPVLRIYLRTWDARIRDWLRPRPVSRSEREDGFCEGVHRESLE